MARCCVLFSPATASLSTEKNEEKLLRRTMALMIETAGASRGMLILRPRDGGTQASLNGTAQGRDCLAGWGVELEARVNEFETRAHTSRDNDDQPMTRAESGESQQWATAGSSAAAADGASSPMSGGSISSVYQDSPRALDGPLTSHIHMATPRGRRMEVTTTATTAATTAENRASRELNQ